MSENTKVWCNINLSRGPFKGPHRNTIGLILTVSVDPAVEEFMQIQSGGKKNSVELIGPNWIPMGDPLEVYTTPKQSTGHPTYVLDSVGRSLVAEGRGVNPDTGEPVPGAVNLSFFKLVGISKPGGVSFGVAGAYSHDYLSNLYRRMLVESKQFLADYITPMNLNLQIISKS